AGRRGGRMAILKIVMPVDLADPQQIQELWITPGTAYPDDRLGRHSF
ncbi:hydrogenase 1 large subunit, partial [Salmonella enterica subsp. enterica serovar Enteritidis str. CHS44]